MMGLVTIRVAPCCKSANDAETQCTNRWLPRIDDAAPEAPRRRDNPNKRLRDAAQTGIEHDPIVSCRLTG